MRGPADAIMCQHHEPVSSSEEEKKKRLASSVFFSGQPQLLWFPFLDNPFLVLLTNENKTKIYESPLSIHA